MGVIDGVSESPPDDEPATISILQRYEQYVFHECGHEQQL